MATKKRKQNKGGSISKADLAKLPEKARRQIEAQIGQIEDAEERAVTPKQKAAVSKRKRSLLGRIGTRLRLIAATKKYKVQARNLNKAPRKTIKVRARTEVDALRIARDKLGSGFDQIRVKNPSKGIYLVSARRKNPGRKHLPAATAKQQRQYEDILKSAKESGRYKGREKEVAARTVRARAAGNLKPKRKSNRQDIHRIVREKIRLGLNQKQILDLMKRSGFRKEYLAEARKIYNQEKNFVRRMRTGKNPKSKVLSTIKKVGKTAIGAVKGAIKGGRKAVKANPKRKRNSPVAERQRRQFAGHFDGYRDLYYPKTNPPKNPSKLGELKSIRTNHADFTPVNGSMWLVRDEGGHLHIGSTKEGVMFEGPVQDLGVVERIEYLERKPHLGDHHLTEYYHRMGEENGRKPHLWSDGQGGLVFRGGDYRIESRGIVN